MAFGEKIKSLRKSKGMNQTQLANALGVSPRTIRGWEAEGRYPKQHELYQKLADTLECDISYLMTEGEAFITEAAEQYGSRGAKQAQQILEQGCRYVCRRGARLMTIKRLSWMRSRCSIWIQRTCKEIHAQEISPPG